MRRWLIASALLINLASLACTVTPQFIADSHVVNEGDAQKGKLAIVKYGCGSCHTIPGISQAQANVGPPLTKVGARSYLAGRLTNSPENMQRWIQHPKSVDPQTAMPELGVSDQDVKDITAYLQSLK